MMFLRFCFVAVLIGIPALAPAQDAALEARVMRAVRAALAPALPFPASDELGSLPADGKATDPWMVRPLQAGDRTIEIIANPLNEANQIRAEQAMAQIDASIKAAQRRAEEQYDRAIAEAKRTGKSQDVDGVTLSDEGVAGARIDAESHVTIDVVFDQPSPPGITITNTPSSVFRDDSGVERFREAEAAVSVGRMPPASANGMSSLVIRMRGNEALLADLLRTSNWNALLELLK